MIIHWSNAKKRKGDLKRPFLRNNFSSFKFSIEEEKKIKVQNCPDLSKEIKILHNKYLESENIPEKIA